MEKLTKWRSDESKESGYRAYIIMDNDTIERIAKGDIVHKEDLLSIKGIGNVRYDLYGDEIYGLLQEFFGDDSEKSICVSADVP